MLDLTRTVFRYDPYPMGLASAVFSHDDYAAMVSTFPDERTFVHMTGPYDKYSLSEPNRKSVFLAYVNATPIWRRFYDYIKGPGFLAQVADTLTLAGLTPPLGPFYTRFEFSALPAGGGRLDPHTDTAKKVVTLVLSMVRAGEWNTEWGGTTDMLRPLDPYRHYVDYQDPLKDFEVVTRFPYAPNVGSIFVKTHNSWHSVGPLTGPIGRWRRTITINIETP